MQNLPPLSIVEPPPPPQRRRLDIDSSFEPTGVSEVLGELELRYNQTNFPSVEIEDLQAHEFAQSIIHLSLI